MYTTGLIVFRETLEAALFVGILAAATRGVLQRSRWLAAGVAVGVLGALAMAAGMDAISAWADGIGAELLNIGIVGLALAMLVWHCVWMSVHGKEMTLGAKRLGAAVRDGENSLWALAVAVAMAVLREGAETVLFVAGFLSGGSADSQSGLWLGVSGGLGAGVLLGLLLYFGLSKVHPRHLFSVTNVMIWLLAGSLASQLARNLVQAGFVERWSEPVWDISGLLSNDDSLGVLLHALVGYDASPMGLQVVFYLGAIGFIVLASRVVQRKHRTT